jgi:hypothetical protein
MFTLKNTRRIMTKIRSKKYDGTMVYRCLCMKRKFKNQKAKLARVVFMRKR